jgi:hypothetical protein
MAALEARGKNLPFPAPDFLQINGRVRARQVTIHYLGDRADRLPTLMLACC